MTVLVFVPTPERVSLPTRLAQGLLDAYSITIEESSRLS